MDRTTAFESLFAWDGRGVRVWTTRDLAKLFHTESPATFAASLKRLVADGTLRRACRGVYVFAHARDDDGRTLERVARALRRGHHSYTSLESALGEHGLISQVMPDRLTVMTTGRRGEIRTPWGTLELVHTARDVRDVLAGSVDAGRPLRLATAETALRDLRRVGRNLHLVDAAGVEP